jgi:hypothetical protein
LGKYIVLNEGEGFYSNFLFFDTNLKEATHLNPFPGKMFAEYNIESDNKHIIIGVKGKNMIKKYLLDENLNVLGCDSILFKIDTDSKSLQGFGQLLYHGQIPMCSGFSAIDGSPMLYGLGKHGEVIWKKKYVINGKRWRYDDNNLSLNFETGKLLAFVNEFRSTDNFVHYSGLLDEKEGIVQNKLDFKAVYQIIINKYLGQKNQDGKIRINYLDWIDSNKYLMLISEQIKRKVHNKRYINNLLLVVDINTNEIEIVDLIQEPSDLIKIFTATNRIELITEKFNYTYERK